MLFKNFARSFRSVNNLQTQIICTTNKSTAVTNLIKKDNSPLVINNLNQANQHLALFSVLALSLLRFIQKQQVDIPLLKHDNCKHVLIVPKHNYNNISISEQSGMVVHVDITGFNAAEVDIRVELGSLIVEAHHEKKLDDGGKAVRQMVQQYEIPPYCDISKVEVKASGSILIITIPPIKSVITRI